MKFLYLSVAFTVGILLVNCEPNTNASPENTNETPLENVDPLIASLRAHKFTPDTTIVLTKADLKALAASFSPVPIEEINPPVDKSTFSAFSTSYILFKDPAKTPMYSASLTSSLTESYVEAALNHLAVGAAGRSTHTDFTVSGLFTRKINPDYSIDVNGEPTYVASSNHNMEVYALYSSEEILLNDRVDVLVGLGLWVGNHDLESIWVYLAKYNPATRKIDWDDDVNSITVISYQIASTRGAEENRLRTFDYIEDRLELEKTVITGFGARTHSGSVSRITLRLSELN